MGKLLEILSYSDAKAHTDVSQGVTRQVTVHTRADNSTNDVDPGHTSNRRTAPDLEDL